MLQSAHPEKTIDLLDNELGLEKMSEEDNMIRFQSEAKLGNTIDVPLKREAAGTMGVGTVHHIAWRCEDDETQLNWRDLLASHGLRPTPVIDRQYFHSVYFRESGGILFEMATDSPGFLIDEQEAKLGQSLLLPPQYEKLRGQLEQVLDPIKIREVKS